MKKIYPQPRLESKTSRKLARRSISRAIETLKVETNEYENYVLNDLQNHPADLAPVVAID